MVRHWLALAALCGLSALPLTTGQAQSVRLYCDAVGAYYPYVTSCAGGWHRFPRLTVVVPVPGTVYPPGTYAPDAYPPGAYPPAAPPPSGYPAAAFPPPPQGQAGGRPDLPPPARERTEEEHAANLENAAEIGMRREQDAADGYRERTLALAASKFQSTGGGFILSGYYSLAEDHALLSDKADTESHIFVVPDKLSKAGRAMLADCDECRITIWAHKGCSKSALGDQSRAPCLVLERVKKGSYEANTTIYR